MKKYLAALLAFAFVSAALANEAHRLITAMPEDQRQKYFAFYLTRSDENCPVVSKAFYQGSDKKGAAFWNIQCAPGKSYVVMMNNDAGGSSRILDCQVLKTVNGGTCFTKFKK